MLEKERADFHIHIGDRTDEDLLKEAQNIGVRAFTALDRGIIRTERLRKLVDYGQNYGVRVLPGVECLTEVKLNGHSISVELLGLDFNLRNPEIFRNFDPQGEVYNEKHCRKVDLQSGFLEKQGFIVNLNSHNHDQWEVIRSGLILDTAVRICRIAASDPNNQVILHEFRDEIDMHMAKRPQDKPQDPNNTEHQSLSKAKFMYWKYFAPGKEGFHKWQLDSDTIFKTLHEAHGVIIIPHPNFQHKAGGTTVEEALDRLFELGVDGIECWDADLLDKPLARKALERGKLVLGGSGQDTNYYSNRIMGKGEKGRERMFISLRRLKDITQYKASHGLI